MNLEQKNLPSTNQKRGQQEEPSETVIRPRIVPVDDDDSEHQEEQGREHMTVLVGRDGVLQDLIEIGELNGVKMARVADLPHDRVRGRERARNIKRTDSYRKTGRGVPRVPIGRRS